MVSILIGEAIAGLQACTFVDRQGKPVWNSLLKPGKCVGSQLYKRNVLWPPTNLFGRIIARWADENSISNVEKFVISPNRQSVVSWRTKRNPSNWLRRST